MNRTEIYYHLRSRLPRDHETLLARVDSLRDSLVLNRVKALGMITVSNHCVHDCLYCGHRAGSKETHRFRLSMSELEKAAETAAACGIKSLVLKSGDDPRLKEEDFAAMAEKLRRDFSFEVALAAGERKSSAYAKWRDSGVAMYWLRHETCDPHLYRRMRPTMFWVDRIQALEAIKQSGLALGTGMLVGMPNQSWESLVDDIIMMRDETVCALVVEPYDPPEGSPGRELLSRHENRLVEPNQVTMEKVIALARLARPEALIPVTQALAELNGGIGEKGWFRAGANGVLFDFTPAPFLARAKKAPFRGLPAQNGKQLKNAKETLDKIGLELVFENALPGRC